MRRRDVIRGIAASAWPIAVHAQQVTMPVVGWLGTGSPTSDAARVSAFRQGLKEIGYVDGQNASIEFRWAENRYDRLPGLAADLVSRHVTAILAGPLPATLAAKVATSTIPIVFANGNDPVKFGLVGSINRPGGNVTGVSFLVNELAAKQIELLHEMVPNASLIGFLVNPKNQNAANDTREVQTAGRALGEKLLVIEASTLDDITAAFATMGKQGAGALLIHADAFFTSQQKQLAALALRGHMPAMYFIRGFAQAGGLMTYGASLTDGYRQAGIYTGRILKGQRPADLPVQQAVKIELAINLKTAKTLGLTVPQMLLTTADAVIE